MPSLSDITSYSMNLFIAQLYPVSFENRISKNYEVFMKADIFTPQGCAPNEELCSCGSSRGEKIPGDTIVKILQS